MPSTSFQSIVKYASELIENGFNVIPVRDKDEQIGEKIMPKKSPFYGWKQWQTNRISVSTFFELLEKSKSTWIAIVLGEISNRTVCIDIDNKHWAGVEHKLFSALKEIYPELWKKLRIHKSQSGGYHIFFSVPEEVEIIRSKKLAYKEGNKEAGIELKGEGGIVVIPPSEGYSIVNNVPIPRLTEQEIAVIMAIIEDINEKKVIRKEKAQKSHYEDSYYSVNPFDDFNHSRRGGEILTDFGWKIEGENAQFIHFTRPDKKGGISATFIKDKFCFHIFTTSDYKLEANVNYSPCAIVQHFRNFDGKQLYQWLIGEGFGKANPEKEIERAKKLAIANKDVAANFTPEAKEVFQQVRQVITDRMPFGDYWKFGQRGEVQISRSKIIEVANNVGFRLFNGELVKIVDEKIIHKKSEREFQDELKGYAFTDDEDFNLELMDALESFYQKATSYIIGRLNIIERKSILNDTKHIAYKCFKNCVVQITADNLTTIDYSEIDQYIEIEKIIPRDFKHSNVSGKYSEYLNLACGLDDYTKKIIGYLAHEWKDETCGYIITLTERVINPKHGGGSGKNIFCNLFKLITTVCNTNGSQLNFDERFLQSWNRERIMSLSDVPKDFPFSFLKEASTGTIKWRRLFHNAIDVEVYDSPKFVIQTNYSYEISDGGVARRIIPLEFSDFFTKAGGVDKHFNCHFPSGWNDNDWSDFDNVICLSIQKWLNSGHKLEARSLSDSGWRKQFEINFGSVIVGALDEYLQGWIISGKTELETVTRQLNEYYNLNDISLKYRPSRKRINEAIEEWSKHNGFDFDKNYVTTVNSISMRYYRFRKIDDVGQIIDESENFEDELPF